MAMRPYFRYTRCPSKNCVGRPIVGVTGQKQNVICSIKRLVNAIRRELGADVIWNGDPPFEIRVIG